MNLFRKEKKFDYKKDKLRLTFDGEKYIFTLYGKEVIYLNRRTKKLLQEKNNELANNPVLLEDERRRFYERLRVEKQYNALKEKGLTFQSFEYLGPDEGTMSQKLTTLLAGLTSEDNILLGIHRSKERDPNTIKNILLNGLNMTGAINQGIISNSVSLSQNVSYYPSNLTIKKELKYADAYDNSAGSFLIRIPYSDLPDKIYIYDGNNLIPRLNPKYIVGYIPLCENHHIEEIITA